MPKYSFIVIALVFGATATAQLETRRYVWNGRAILSELKADDRHVEIETADYPLPPMPLLPGMSHLESAVVGTDLIAVGLVEAREPIFVSPDMGVRHPATAETATWIDSRLAIRLTRVIKDRGFGVSEGSLLQGRQAGGRARIGGVLVDAIVPWRLPLLEGKTYLIFGVRHEGEYFHIGAYEVDEARRLRKMASSSTNPRWRDRFGAAPQTVATDDFELWGADPTIVYLESEVRRRIEEERTTTPR